MQENLSSQYQQVISRKILIKIFPLGPDYFLEKSMIANAFTLHGRGKMTFHLRYSTLINGRDIKVLPNQPQATIV